MSIYSSHKYQKIKDFLKYLIDSREDQLKKGEVGLDGFEIAQTLGCGEKETNEIMEIFAEFYQFFKNFFLSDGINHNENIKKNKDNRTYNDKICKVIEISNKNTGLLSDFALLFKKMPESELKIKFPDLFDLLNSNPELFQKCIKLSGPALKFTENIRKFKVIGKTKREMNVGDFKFKITD